MQQQSQFSTRPPSQQALPFPSKGPNYTDDFNPGTRRYTVPLVEEDDMRRRGATYIDEYIPPCLRIGYGNKLIAVTHAAKDTFNVMQEGTLEVQANNNGIPMLPPHPDDHTDSQTLTFPLVLDNNIASKGLISQCAGLPVVKVRRGGNGENAGEMVTLFAVPPSLRESKLLSVDGEITIPKLNALGPYPIRFPPKYEVNGHPGFVQREQFAIPPDPRKGAVSERAEGGEAMGLFAHPSLGYYPILLVFGSLLVAFLLAQAYHGK